MPNLVEKRDELMQWKKDFIEFLVRSGVLTFGDFTLKSGRRCPYFLNFGKISSGGSIYDLGHYYALGIKAISELKNEYDVIFGPAYKGIPISVATSIALTKDEKLKDRSDVLFAFNRKEIKSHGEGGQLIGAPIDSNTRVIIVDDVITAGTALRETLEILKNNGAPHISAIVLGVDRMEKGIDGKNALVEFWEKGYKVFALVSISEIVSYLTKNKVDGTLIIDNNRKNMIDAYLSEYGSLELQNSKAYD